MLARQLSQIGISTKINFNHFPELGDKLHRNKAQFFGIAWNSDYPDAENNLAMFYGPNSGAMNHFHYQNPVYDALYRRASTMVDSPTRTKLYEECAISLLKMFQRSEHSHVPECIYGTLELQNMKPSEIWYGWLKYLDVETR